MPIERALALLGLLALFNLAVDVIRLIEKIIWLCRRLFVAIFKSHGKGKRLSDGSGNSLHSVFERQRNEVFGPYAGQSMSVFLLIAKRVCVCLTLPLLHQGSSRQRKGRRQS